MADTVKIDGPLPAATTIQTEGAERKCRKERNEEWRAKQRQARTERLKAKKETINARREALGLKPGDPLPEDKDCLEAFKAQLPNEKVIKLRKKLHVLRREIKTKIKKVAMFEIQRIIRKMRRIKDGKLKPGERESDIAGLEERLEQVKALDQDGLIECAVYRIKKHSEVISEMIGRNDKSKLPASPEVRDLLEQKLVRHLLAAERIKGAIRKHVLDLEGVITGKNKKPYRDMMKEQRRVKNLKKYEARMQRAQARKERQQMAENEKGESVEDGSDESPASENMYVDKLGDFVSDDNISDSDNDKVKRKKSSKGEHETSRSKIAKKHHSDDDDDDDDEDIDEEDFNKIYQGNNHKNRPGQRARRQKYEKMYGNEANHIKLMAKDKKPSKSPPEKKKDMETPTVKVETSSKSSSQQMHPSWEAKRREKQIMEKAKNVKGNKIVFD